MILIRVYGLCTNARGELLITHERYDEHRMTKFPAVAWNTAKAPRIASSANSKKNWAWTCA